MGLLDGLKKATGVGLDADGAYDRAYQKAVLLGRAEYANAPALFQKAADRADQAGNGPLGGAQE
jgi:hypothetical protein